MKRAAFGRLFFAMLCYVLTITILLSRINVLYFNRFFAIIIMNILVTGIVKINLYK